MMNKASAIFDAEATSYEAARRRLIPCYDAFYGTAVAALGLLARPPRRILDLGAGTGLLSRRVHAAHPGAELVLLDGAPAMLEQARAALGDAATLVVGDLADALPVGPFDAVVSALAIHHLADPAKRLLLRRVHDVLEPGGLFVNAEQIAGESPWLEAVHVRWHEEQARAAGVDDAGWAAAQRRMSVDRCATIEDQLAWLREAGFADAGVLFAEQRFAVLVARR